MTKNSSNTRIFTLNCKGRLLVIDKPIVMGIINITPDSFYSGSRFNDMHKIVEQAGKMLSEGAAIFDIGGQSTRPGARQIEADEELKRVIPVIAGIIKTFPSALISVDTYHSLVAKESVKAGACIVNDISGGFFDANMLGEVASSGAVYICMHTKGSPETMHFQPAYEKIHIEVMDYFIERIHDCYKAGIKDLVVDPGFGFAKNIQHNFQLLKNLSLLQILQKPVMIGISRKSTIYKTLNVTPQDALNGTTVLNTLGLINGADTLRVHDVKEAVEAITLFQEYRGSGSQ